MDILSKLDRCRDVADHLSLIKGSNISVDAKIINALEPEFDGCTAPYTHSLDCSIALVSRTLPKWSWYVGCENGQPMASITFPGSREDLDFGAPGPTPAIALLRALFSVLVKKEKAAIISEKRNP